MMNIRPIHTKVDYEATLERIDSLMDAQPGTADGDELDVLTMLVEHYEQKQFPIDSPDPVEFIKNAMEFLGVEQKGLADLLNSRSRASEILNRRRPLTLDQIRRIAAAWQIPADPLIGEYEVNTGR